jgi:hypothetical protein
MRIVNGNPPADSEEMLFASDVRKLTGRNKSELLKDTTFPRQRGGSREDAYWSVSDVIDWATAPRQ